MRRLLLLAAAAFAIGFLLPPILALITYNREFVTNLGWVASIFSGPTPFAQYLTSLGWSALVELIPQPLKETVTAMGFSVSVSSGPTPFARRETPLAVVSTLNVTKTDAFNLLRTDEWWIASDIKPSGEISVNMMAADLPHKVRVDCKSPPCRFQVFLPFGVSDVNITMTAGDATYLLAALGNGTLVTITLDESGGSPLDATIRWIGEYSLTVTDYKGRSRDAELRLVFADGTEVVLTPGTNRHPIYPIVNMSWSPAGRLITDPSNTRCRVITHTFESTGTLLAPPAFGSRCEIGMLYVLGSSLRDVSVSPQIGGLYRVDGRLVDEEGSPVPGRRILVFLQGNLTKPAETVTGPDGRFSSLIYVPPSNRTRLLTVRFPGEPALMPSSKALEIPGTGAGTAPTTQVPGSVYAFLGAMIAAFVAVIVLSFVRASRRAHAIYRSRRVLR